MSPDCASRRLVLLAPLLIAACGFAPAYGPGGEGARLDGRLSYEAPDTPDGFLLRARLEDRLGRAATPEAILAVEVEVSREAAAVTPEGSITRYDLAGRASWRLARGDGTPLAEGEVSAFTGSSATGTTVATRAAEEDARARLMTLLADAIVARLLLLPPGTLGEAAP